jgi:hypothetical protein
VWTPKRIVLLAVGFALFLAAYVIYAHFLGGINGLPPLPSAYLGTGEIDTDPPSFIDTATEAKLRQAFGEDCDEAKRKIRLELGLRGMVLAAQDFHILSDGNAPSRKVQLEPVSLAIFGKKRAEGEYPEITTIRGRRATLELDKPINNPLELSSCKVTGGTLETDIIVINNRRTPQRDDDISVYTPGPLFYSESLHRIFTDRAVRLVDPGNRPNPTNINGQGMDIILATDSAAPGKPAHASKKGQTENPGGVERIELRQDVEMHLWVDGHDGFLGSGTKSNATGSPAKKKPTSTAGAKAATEPTQADKQQVIINTWGKFVYELQTNHATFFNSESSGNRPNIVSVDCVNKLEGKHDRLECDHLELQFRKKEATEGAPIADEQSEGLTIETAHATGKEVILISDAELLEAHGTDFYYDKLNQRTVLKGEPNKMWAIKEGNLIEAPVLELLEVKGSQQATAFGEGRVEMLDKAKGTHPIRARWRDKLIYAKEGNQDVLTLVGNAAFTEDSDKEGAQPQELRADSLKVWLVPSEPGEAPANNQVGNDQTRRKLQHLDAVGHVTTLSAEMRVHDTDHLVAYFKDVPPAADQLPAPAASTASAPAQASAPASNAVSNPAATNATTAPAKGGTTATVHDTPTKQPIDLSARLIVVHALRSGAKNDLDKVWCEGGVRVHQEPATPEDRGVDIRGETLDLTHHIDGNVLVVTGNYAQVQINKVAIVGSQVTIDQPANEVWVNGLGAMSMLSNTAFDGSKNAQPKELHVNWEKRMFFNGLTATYNGGVRAEQEGGRLSCEAMQATLDHKVSLREGEKKDQSSKVERLLCDKDIWLEDIKYEEGRLVSLRHMKSASLLVDNDTATDDDRVEAPGPGIVRLFQLGAKDEVVPGTSIAPTPTSHPSNGPKKAESGNAKAEQETKLTQVTYEGRMTAKNKQGIATFYDGVVVIHIATPDPELRLNPDRLPPGAMLLTCERLKVLSQKMKDGSTAKELWAFGRAFFDDGQCQGTADLIKYDEMKDLVVLESHRDDLAVLYRRQIPGSNPDGLHAKTIRYWRKDGHFDVEGAREMNVKH